MGKETAYIGRSCGQRIREPENLATRSSGEGTQPEAGKAGRSVRGSAGRQLASVSCGVSSKKKTHITKKEDNEISNTCPDLAQQPLEL